MRTVPSLLSALLLAGCAAPWSHHEAAPLHSPVHYSCEDGLALRVRFARDGAHVTLPSGEQVFLPKQAADGTYAGVQHEFTGKGDTGTWKAGRRVPVTCRVQR